METTTMNTQNTTTLSNLGAATLRAMGMSEHIECAPMGEVIRYVLGSDVTRRLGASCYSYEGGKLTMRVRGGKRIEISIDEDANAIVATFSTMTTRSPRSQRACSLMSLQRLFS